MTKPNKRRRAPFYDRKAPEYQPRFPVSLWRSYEATRAYCIEWLRWTHEVGKEKG
jgi:hypothetical protein